VFPVGPVTVDADPVGPVGPVILESEVILIPSTVTVIYPAVIAACKSEEEYISDSVNSLFKSKFVVG
jgi:hypothetical protein